MARASPSAANDVIVVDGHKYVPFAPFPAIVADAARRARRARQAADQVEPGVNAFLAATVVFLAWWVQGRIGVERLRDRVAMVLLLGFGTQVWWVTTRGGVWHTGHLVAMILTLLLLAEMFGRKRAVLMGLLVGAAFLTRAPLAFAGPAIALWVVAVVVRARGPRHARRATGSPRSRGPVGLAARRLPAGPAVLPLVQPRPLRLRDGVRLRAGDAARRGWRRSASWGCSRIAHVR